jgi:hypothetical protein
MESERRSKGFQDSEKTVAQSRGWSFGQDGAPARQRSPQVRYAAALPRLRPSTVGSASPLRFTQPRALGRTVSDEFLVPICRLHHRELHRSGDEATWWQKLNIDPIPVALRLWQQTQAGPELVATTGDVTQGQAAKIPDISTQDRGTSRSPVAEAESSVSQSTDGLANG